MSRNTAASSMALTMQTFLLITQQQYWQIGVVVCVCFIFLFWLLPEGDSMTKAELALTLATNIVTQEIAGGMYHRIVEVKQATLSLANELLRWLKENDR